MTLIAPINQMAGSGQCVIYGYHKSAHIRAIIRHRIFYYRYSAVSACTFSEDVILCIGHATDKMDKCVHCVV